MTLTEAIAKRDLFRADGVKCAIRFVSGDEWEIVYEGVDYF